MSPLNDIDNNVDAAGSAHRRVLVSWALALGPGMLLLSSIWIRMVFRFGFTSGGGPSTWEGATWGLFLFACPFVVLFNAIRVTREDAEPGDKIAAWIAMVVSVFPALGFATFSI
jgi:hypothetical protein